MRGEHLDTVYPILGLAPAAAWLMYFRQKERYQPKSFLNLLRVFFWGCVLTVPVALIEHSAGAGLMQPNLAMAAGASFLVIAPIEEFAKLLAVWIAVYRTQDFREPIDGIIYSATAALGFACIENVIYLCIMGPSVLVSRAAYATPAHVMFSAMWGYSMGVARFKREGEIAIILKGFLISAALHGIYNFVVAVRPKLAVFSLLPLMLFMAWLMNRRIKEFRSSFPFPVLGEGALIICPGCGAYSQEDSDQCSRCGFATPLMATDTPRFCSKCRSRLDPCRTTCALCGQPVNLSRYCAPARERSFAT
jgi:protease PrsW